MKAIFWFFVFLAGALGKKPPTYGTPECQAMGCDYRISATSGQACASCDAGTFNQPRLPANAIQLAKVTTRQHGLVGDTSDQDKKVTIPDESFRLIDANSILQCKKEDRAMGGEGLVRYPVTNIHVLVTTGFKVHKKNQNERARQAFLTSNFETPFWSQRLGSAIPSLTWNHYDPQKPPKKHQRGYATFSYFKPLSHIAFLRMSEPRHQNTILPVKVSEVRPKDDTELAQWMNELVGARSAEQLHCAAMRCRQTEGSSASSWTADVTCQREAAESLSLTFYCNRAETDENSVGAVMRKLQVADLDLKKLRKEWDAYQTELPKKCTERGGTHVEVGVRYVKTLGRIRQMFYDSLRNTKELDNHPKPRAEEREQERPAEGLTKQCKEFWALTTEMSLKGAYSRLAEVVAEERAKQQAKQLPGGEVGGLLG